MAGTEDSAVQAGADCKRTVTAAAHPWARPIVAHGEAGICVKRMAPVPVPYWHLGPVTRVLQELRLPALPRKFAAMACRGISPLQLARPGSAQAADNASGVACLRCAWGTPPGAGVAGVVLTDVDWGARVGEDSNGIAVVVRDSSGREWPIRQPAPAARTFGTRSGRSPPDSAPRHAERAWRTPRTRRVRGPGRRAACRAATAGRSAEPDSGYDPPPPTSGALLPGPPGAPTRCRRHLSSASPRASPRSRGRGDSAHPSGSRDRRPPQP